MAVPASGLEAPSTSLSSADTRPRCRLFPRAFPGKEREYPYLMQPDGSFTPDARPYGGKTLIMYLVVAMCLMAALILSIIIALGPPSIPNMYLLQLCGREGCQSRFISFGVFQLVFYAASDDASERTISVFSSWSDVYQRLEPAVLQDIVPEPSRTIAGLMICSIFLLLMIGACFAWSLGHVVSFNSHLSHGAGLAELVLKREKALKFLMMFTISSFAPFATLLAAVVLVKSENNASSGAFDIFTAYVSPWQYDDMHEGQAVVLLEVACGVLGTALIVAMLIAKRTAEPIAGRSEPPQIAGPRTISRLQEHDLERAKFTVPDAGIQGPDSQTHLQRLIQANGQKLGPSHRPDLSSFHRPNTVSYSSSSESSSLTDGTSYPSQVLLHGGGWARPRSEKARAQEQQNQQAGFAESKSLKDRLQGPETAEKRAKARSAEALEDIARLQSPSGLSKKTDWERRPGFQQPAATQGPGRHQRGQVPSGLRHKRKPPPQILSGSSFEALKSPIGPPGRTNLKSDLTPAPSTFGPEAFHYSQRGAASKLQQGTIRSHRQAYPSSETQAPVRGYAEGGGAVAAGLQQPRRPGIVI